jgi:hypothetical protein
MPAGLAWVSLRRRGRWSHRDRSFSASAPLCHSTGERQPPAAWAPGWAWQRKPRWSSGSNPGEARNASAMASAEQATGSAGRVGAMGTVRLQTRPRPRPARSRACARPPVIVTAHPSKRRLLRRCQRGSMRRAECSRRLIAFSVRKLQRSAGRGTGGCNMPACRGWERRMEDRPCSPNAVTARQRAEHRRRRPRARRDGQGCPGQEGGR